MRFSTSAFLLGAATSAVALPEPALLPPSGLGLDFEPVQIKPPTINRVPDSEWDHIVRGADVQRAGEKQGAQKRVDGDLASFDLRVRSVNTTSLGLDTVNQFAGYLDNNDEDKHLFYWFFESRNNPKKDPVVLWLNGGPGCSSLLGLFGELGPATIPNKDLKPVRNPYAWNNNASVIFIDQPVNVGYSYSSRSVNTTAAAGKDIYALLTLFFTQFPQYATQDFHIAGESYGGHYVPIFAHEVLSHANRNINLKSILVGNGLTDPLTQYNYYRPMACGEGGWPAVLNETTCQEMDKALPKCERLIKECYKKSDPKKCYDATDYCNNEIIGAYDVSGRSDYDVRPPVDGPDDYSNQFLNSASIKKALGVEVAEYGGCNGEVNGNFVRHGDWMLPIQRTVTKLLEKIPVLIYAGDADFICNWLGNRAWTKALPWHGHDAFNAAPTTGLNLGGKNGKEYGKVTSSSGLTFIQVYAAGHMVPADQPEASLNFFNRWIGGEWPKK